MTNNREWMKTRHLAVITIITLSTLTVMTFHPAQGISGSAFFMKSNSTAKLYVDFTIPVLNNQSWDLKPEIFTSTDDSITNPSDLNIDAHPSSFTGNSHHVYVTYTLTAKGNTKGVYSLFLFSCGSSPLVVGLNESEVNPAIYNKFFTAVYLCPAMSAGTPDLNIIGYSGIISKTLSISSNNTITVTSVSKLGEPPQSPLKQLKSGVKKSDIKCNQDFVLVIKKEGHWPACVNPDTVSKLVLRGWTENPLDELLLRYGNQTQANLVFYEIMNEPKVREWSMKGWKYSSYSYASNGETQKFSATIDLYLPSGIGNHLECENGSYALVVMNLKPVEIEHNSTQVGCNIVSFSIAPNESGMAGKNLNTSAPLKLSLLIDNQYANPAQPIGVDMSLNNTSSNRLTLNSEDNWPRSDLSSGSCSNLPFGMAILKGYYTEQNMTGTSSLVIYPNLPCPLPPLIKSYTFEPLSNMATQECDSLFSCPGSTNMKIHLKIDGFIDNNGQHRPFNVGKYTIIAGDEWGHVTIQHFTEAYGTPLISSENNCGQFYTAPENQRDLKTVPVLLMNTNSTGCAKLSFAIGYSYNGTVWPRIASFAPILFIGNVHYSTNGNSFSVTPGKDYTNSFKITVMPETIDLANYPVGSKFSVTYIIRPLPNATGFYDQSIPKLVCERYPLAVGFTADQVNASDFNYIYPLNPPCASGPYQLTGVEISGMNYKWVTLP